MKKGEVYCKTRHKYLHVGSTAASLQPTDSQKTSLSFANLSQQTPKLESLDIGKNVAPFNLKTTVDRLFRRKGNDVTFLHRQDEAEKAAPICGKFRRTLRRYRFC